MSKRKDMIDIKVDGIPAKAYIMTYFVKKPDYGCWSSDLDFNGYTELEYDLHDRKGYKAPWLERKLEQNEDIKNKVEQEIMDELDRFREEY